LAAGGGDCGGAEESVASVPPPPQPAIVHRTVHSREASLGRTVRSTAVARGRRLGRSLARARIGWLGGLVRIVRLHRRRHTTAVSHNGPRLIDLTAVRRRVLSAGPPTRLVVDAADAGHATRSVDVRRIPRQRTACRTLFRRTNDAWLSSLIQRRHRSFGPGVGIRRVASQPLPQRRRVRIPT
jgi:hypothetical protein